MQIHAISDLLFLLVFQNKRDLMISPLAVPYALMTMHIRYKFKDTGYMTSIVLSNSVLKFATYP